MRFKSHARTSIVLLFLWFIIVPLSRAQNVIVEFTADPTEGLTVGDPVTLHLSVTHPADDRVLPPVLPQEWGDFEVRSQSTTTVTSHQDGTATTTQDIQAALFAPGDFTTPDFSVTVISPDGSSTEQAVPPVTLTVNSVLTPDDSALRDIKPQIDLQPPSLLPQFILIALAVIVAVSLVCLFYRRFVRKNVDALAVEIDLRTPYERARDELRALEALDMVGQGLYKAYYSRLSEILRLYIEGVYGINAPDMTTFEIRRALRQNPGLDTTLTQQVIKILNDCDLVKFAKSEPETGAARIILEQVHAWLERTRPAPSAGMPVEDVA